MVSGLAVSVMVLALGMQAEVNEVVADTQVTTAPARVYVAGVDASRFEQVFSPALAAGRYGNASRLTGIGRTITTDAAGDINLFERELRRHFADSARFELVNSPESADYVMIAEADYISSDFRRRFRGVLKLVDVASGEDSYRRRVDLPSISTQSTLNRELSAAMNLMEEWSVGAVR